MERNENRTEHSSLDLCRFFPYIQEFTKKSSESIWTCNVTTLLSWSPPDGKLYLEFGGKMLEDFHAARVLPGYEPDTDRCSKNCATAEIATPSMPTILSTQKPVNFYDQEVLSDRQIHELGIFVALLPSPNMLTSCSRRLSQTTGQERHRLISTIRSRAIRPIWTTSSPEGMGKNDYIKTSRNLVVVTAPGPKPCKLATSNVHVPWPIKWDQIRLVLSLKPSQYGIFLCTTQLAWFMKQRLQI